MTGEAAATLAMLAELAAVLTRPSSSSQLTPNERAFLAHLAGHPRDAHQPARMITEHPRIFGRRSEQGLHTTAHSLMRKHLIWWDRDEQRHVVYRIRLDHLKALLEAERAAL